MSSHVSSGGTSGVWSIATSVDELIGPDESGFLSESDGAVVGGGGGADDILEGKEKEGGANWLSRRYSDAKDTRTQWPLI